VDKISNRQKQAAKRKEKLAFTDNLQNRI